MTRDEVKALAWEKMGNLIPAIVQNGQSSQVLMMGYMNREALETTLESRKVTFYSRSKKRLWMKGESSGNVLKLIDIYPDCDGDTLLITADPAGPTCHTGAVSCFGKEEKSQGCFLDQLYQLIDDRYQSRPEGSYTTELFERGVTRIARKVGEEAVELVIAALGSDKKHMKDEAADLLFHLLVLFREKDILLDEVIEVLRQRRKPK